MPQRLSAQRTANRGDQRGRSSAPAKSSAPVAGPSRSSPGAGLAPEITSVLELQRSAGNRAVTAAIASGAMWPMPGGPRVQRAPGDPNVNNAEKAGPFAQAITEPLHKAVQAAHSKMQHLPDAQADMWIGIIDTYAKLYPDPTSLRLLARTDPEDLIELLRPWGYVGRVIKAGPGGITGRLADDQPIESLVKSLAAWKGEDARARKKRRASTQGMFGFYNREPTLAEMARDDEVILAGPSRDAPGEPWVDTAEGTRANRRSQRQDIKNQHALAMMQSIATQGPGGFAGMVFGGIIGLAPGIDFHKSTEFWMTMGSMTDTFIVMLSGKMPSDGGGGGGGGGQSAHRGKASPREKMPSPDLPGLKPSGSAGGGGGGGGSGASGGAPGKTSPGVGAAGTAGEGAAPRPGPPTSQGMGVARPASGPAGGGANKALKAGPVAQVRPEQVIAQFKGDANTVFHSASDFWHTIQWLDALITTKQWDFTKGPAPKAPMAFRLKGGGIQVNDLQWVKEGRKISDIVRPSQLSDRAGQEGSGGKGGTEVGVAPGPGGSPGGQPAKGGQGGQGGTRVGHARGEGAYPQLKWDPKKPSPNPPGDTVRAATVDEVKKAFEADPRSVTVGGDGPSGDGRIPDMHQYVWEYRRWWDGRPTKDAAPAAFWDSKGHVRVDPVKWRQMGQDPMALIEPASAGRQPTEFEGAKTMPGGGGGAGSTMGGSIAPGVGKKP